MIKVFKTKTVKILICTLLIFSLLSMTVSASTWTINLTRHSQQMSLWCWAACTQMFLEFYGYSITQGQIVGNTYSYPPPNNTGNVAQIRTAIHTTSNNNILTETGATLTTSQVQAKISSGDTIIIRMLWNNGSGHFMMVDEYRSTPVPMLRLVDPLPNNTARTLYAHSSLLSGVTIINAGTGQWTHYIIKS